jgi:hypothetical protein
MREATCHPRNTLRYEESWRVRDGQFGHQVAGTKLHGEGLSGTRSNKREVAVGLAVNTRRLTHLASPYRKLSRKQSLQHAR